MTSRFRIRQDICNRAAGHCAYCNVYVGMRGTLDHYYPLARGGSWAYSNLRWACLRCNHTKADMLPHEWERRGAFVGPPRETKRQMRLRLLAQCAIRMYDRVTTVPYRPAQAGVKHEIGPGSE